MDDGIAGPVFIVGMIAGLILIMFGYIICAEHSRLACQKKQPPVAAKPESTELGDAHKRDYLRGEFWRDGVRPDEDYDEEC